MANQEQQLSEAGAAFAEKQNDGITIKPFIQNGSLLIEVSKTDWETEREFLDYVENAKVFVRALIKEKYGEDL